MVHFYSHFYELLTYILYFSLFGCQLPILGFDECSHRADDSGVINGGIQKLIHKLRRVDGHPYGVEHRGFQGYRHTVVHTFLTEGRCLQYHLAQRLLYMYRDANYRFVYKKLLTRSGRD